MSARNRVIRVLSAAVVLSSFWLRPSKSSAAERPLTCTQEETLQCICGATPHCYTQQQPPQGYCWGGQMTGCVDGNCMGTCFQIPLDDPEDFCGILAQPGGGC